MGKTHTHKGNVGCGFRGRWWHGRDSRGGRWPGVMGIMRWYSRPLLSAASKRILERVNLCGAGEGHNPGQSGFWNNLLSFCNGNVDQMGVTRVWSARQGRSRTQTIPIASLDPGCTGLACMCVHVDVWPCSFFGKSSSSEQHNTSDQCTKG